MQKVLIFRLHRYEYIENKYKDTNIIVHKLQCSQVSCQRHKHKHATLQMHPLTCIFLCSFSHVSKNLKKILRRKRKTYLLCLTIGKTRFIISVFFGAG